MIRVLVAARRATARARLEAVVAGAPALRLVPALAGVPVARQLEELRPDLVLLDLEDDRLETVLGGPAGADRAALIVLAEEPRRVMTDEPLGRGPVRAVLPRDASAGELLAAIERSERVSSHFIPTRSGARRGPSAPSRIRVSP